MEEIQLGEMLEAVHGPDCQRLGLCEVGREVVHQCYALSVGWRGDVNDKACKKPGESNINKDDAQESAQLETHREFHHWF